MDAKANRQVIDDGTWFDLAAAERYEESTTWNGQNRISDATGSQWEHEELYRTARRAWVLHSWSQWQGSRDSWTRIDDAAAHAWLIRMGHHDAVPRTALGAAEV